ncbi:hypothetical protein INR49_000974 [Caranx melampygus]|nr:hypothetical protein INR49_000974 [Caranx melampygus]
MQTNVTELHSYSYIRFMVALKVIKETSVFFYIYASYVAYTVHVLLKSFIFPHGETVLQHYYMHIHAFCSTSKSRRSSHRQANPHIVLQYLYILNITVRVCKDRFQIKGNLPK